MANTSYPSDDGKGHPPRRVPKQAIAVQVRACSGAVCKAVPLRAPKLMLMIQDGQFCTHQLKNAEYPGGAPNGGDARLAEPGFAGGYGHVFEGGPVARRRSRHRLVSWARPSAIRLGAEASGQAERHGCFDRGSYCPVPASAGRSDLPPPRLCRERPRPSSCSG